MRTLGAAPAVLIAHLALLSAGCGSTQIRYYQPAVVVGLLPTAKAPPLACVLSVETFASDAALDEQRIVYRESAHRFDYYHFHRWSAPPGEIASAVLRETIRRLGRFRAVIGGLDPRAGVVLSGRVVAFEEVDVDEHSWQAHVAVEVTLRNNRTGAILWSDLVEEREPIKKRSPEGVASSVSRSLTRIGQRISGEIQEVVDCGAGSSAGVPPAPQVLVAVP